MESAITAQLPLKIVLTALQPQIVQLVQMKCLKLILMVNAHVKETPLPLFTTKVIILALV